MERRLLNVGQLMPLAVICLALAGCGRSYHVLGAIVAAKDAAEASIVEVSVVGECSGSPIRAATVRLVYELDSNQKPVPQTVWQRTIAAGQDGYFELKDYGPAGGAQSVGLEISSDGYETVYIVYRDRPQQQHVFCASLRAVRGVTTTYN